MRRLFLSHIEIPPRRSVSQPPLTAASPNSDPNSTSTSEPPESSKKRKSKPGEQGTSEKREGRPRSKSQPAAMNKARQAAQTVSAIELTVSDGTEWLVQGKVFNGPEKVYTVKNAPKLGREQVGEVFIELGEEQGEHVYYRHLLARTLLKKYYQGTLEREPDCEFILLSLPAGYRLYCRIAQEKTTPTAKKVSVTKQYRVYGHPNGNYFSKPDQFIDHMHFLALPDGSKPPKCPCAACVAPPGNGTNTPAPTKAPAKKTQIEVAIPVKKPAAKGQSTLKFPAVQKQTPQASPQIPQQQVVQSPQVQIQNTPTPPIQLSQQQVMAQYAQHFDLCRKIDQEGGGLYRPGEIIWVENGANWALGVVLAVIMAPTPNTPSTYRVQKFVCPAERPASPAVNIMDKVQETGMRPWISWTAPEPTVKELTGQKLLEVDWKKYVGQSNMLALDASILACKRAERSYTLIDPVPSSTPNVGIYRGVYFGAEKIWSGDILLFKLETPYNPDHYFVVSHLEEVLLPSGEAPRVIAVGDIYRMIPGDKSPASTPQPPNLPARLRKDLYVRNHFFSLSNQATRTIVLVKQNQPVDLLKDIKSRWYEYRLVEYMKGMQQIREEATRGIYSEVITNQMGMNSKEPWERIARRADVFGETLEGQFVANIDRPAFATNPGPPPPQQVQMAPQQRQIMQQPQPAPVITQRMPPQKPPTIIQVMPEQAQKRVTKRTRDGGTPVQQQLHLQPNNGPVQQDAAQQQQVQQQQAQQQAQQQQPQQQQIQQQIQQQQQQQQQQQHIHQQHQQQPVHQNAGSHNNPIVIGGEQDMVDDDFLQQTPPQIDDSDLINIQNTLDSTSHGDDYHGFY